jgi:hypothetical protein
MSTITSSSSIADKNNPRFGGADADLIGEELKKEYFVVVVIVGVLEIHTLAFFENADTLPTFVRTDAIIVKARANNIGNFLLL